jgi:hypothetical protein
MGYLLKIKFDCIFMILSKKQKMSPCLIHQLFRQKIGLELDQSLVDEVPFSFTLVKEGVSKRLALGHQDDTEL